MNHGLANLILDIYNQKDVPRLVVSDPLRLFRQFLSKVSARVSLRLMMNNPRALVRPASLFNSQTLFTLGARCGA